MRMVFENRVSVSVVFYYIANFFFFSTRFWLCKVTSHLLHNINFMPCFIFSAKTIEF